MNINPITPAFKGGIILEKNAFGYKFSKEDEFGYIGQQSVRSRMAGMFSYNGQTGKTGIWFNESQKEFETQTVNLLKEWEITKFKHYPEMTKDEFEKATW